MQGAALHTAGHNVGRVRYFFTRHFDDWRQPDELIFNGLVFEVGRCYYWRRFPDPGASRRDPPNGATIVAGLEAPPDPELVEALDEWGEWVRRTPHDEMDWRDRLYLEQRLGGWASSNRQALDLIDGDEFSCSNSQAYIAAVLQVPESLRKSSRHQVDLIARMAPELSGFPFNPPDSLYRRGVRRLRRVAKRLRRDPFA